LGRKFLITDASLRLNISADMSRAPLSSQQKGKGCLEFVSGMDTTTEKTNIFHLNNICLPSSGFQIGLSGVQEFLEDAQGWPYGAISS
jgi:hypothetical protein